MVDGIAKLVCTAECADDFVHVAALGNGRDFQHVGQRELEFAVAGIYFQEVIQNFTGLGFEIVEERQFLPLEAVSVLMAGDHRHVEMMNAPAHIRV